uniref:Uncharacterized protein n=1 Tax=Arundo donax TaxID=35708 RepID=A0A0A9AII4_ARUDO
MQNNNQEPCQENREKYLSFFYLKIECWC